MSAELAVLATGLPGPLRRVCPSLGRARRGLQVPPPLRGAGLAGDRRALLAGVVVCAPLTLAPRGCNRLQRAAHPCDTWSRNTRHVPITRTPSRAPEDSVAGGRGSRRPPSVGCCFSARVLRWSRGLLAPLTGEPHAWRHYRSTALR